MTADLRIHRAIALSIALLCLLMACSRGPGTEGESGSSGAGSASPAPAPTAAPTPSVTQVAKKLRGDLLKLRPDAVAEPADAPSGLYFEDSNDDPHGLILYEPFLSVSFPTYTERLGKAIDRVFGRHGFVFGLVPVGLEPRYTSDQLRCRRWAEAGSAIVRCVAMDYIRYVNREVAGPVTDRYVDDTGDIGMTCWAVQHFGGRGPGKAAAVLRAECDIDSATRYFYVLTTRGWRSQPFSKFCVRLEADFPGVCDSFRGTAA